MTFVRICCCMTVVLLAQLTVAKPLCAQTVSDVVAFDYTNYLGSPAFAPTQTRDKLLYGSIASPSGDPGAIINFAPAGGSYHVEFTLSYALGSVPLGGLTLGTDGSFYGVTAGGGSGYGVLFKVTPDGAYTVLHEFTGGTDSGEPESAPIEGADGNIYGVTFGACCAYSTVYKYNTRSGVFSTIYIFDLAHGEFANSIMQGSDGDLYVTSFEGGINFNGTIAKLSTSGKLLSYYPFPGSPGGTFPDSPLVEAPDGNYYGVTQQGGYPGNGYGSGTVFRMTPRGKVTTLYAFCGGGGLCPDGFNPSALVLANDGNLYGVTSRGGAHSYGTLFRIGTGRQFSSLYSFGSDIGETPVALMQDTNGLLYGSAFNGGTYGYGAVFSADFGLPPFITFVQPTGKVGHSAQILGQGLTGATSVTFNGVRAASVSVKSDTYLTAVVPTAATTGPVVVTTPGGALMSNKNFTVLK